MARKLRFAVSILFGLVTVTMCIWCVRSFWRRDSWRQLDGTILLLQSNRGLVFLQHATGEHLKPQGAPMPLTYYNSPADGRVQPWHIRYDIDGLSLAAPHLLLALLPATIACLPWLRWKFSLRTLLIATTLFAIVLGLAAWAKQ